jgi:hypothetical protein
MASQASAAKSVIFGHLPSYYVRQAGGLRLDRRRQALTADYYWPGIQGTAGSGLVGDPSLIEGALLRADGPRLPVVYLPRVDRPASATSPIIGADRHLYGRLVGPIQRRATLGDEHRDEVVAFDAVTIEEEL